MEDDDGDDERRRRVTQKKKVTQKRSIQDDDNDPTIDLTETPADTKESKSKVMQEGDHDYEELLSKKRTRFVYNNPTLLLLVSVGFARTSLCLVFVKSV
jgi:hypothetical protein